MNILKCVRAQICQGDHRHKEGLEIVHTFLMEMNVLMILMESIELHGLQVVVPGKFV